eukprot:TRINITY_DN4113_c0_g1_i1.p2 TRINITY_DN4113_c0_g1~~TRINITY_DN4113_c0_g1_i1.p2  ORF type:complete len:121 (-),score=14.51 TRINITY_DN4113_c0_g1_i1:569-931(-)
MCYALCMQLQIKIKSMDLPTEKRVRLVKTAHPKQRRGHTHKSSIDSSPLRSSKDAFPLAGNFSPDPFHGPGAYEVPSLIGFRKVCDSYNNAPAYTIPHKSNCSKLFISKRHCRVQLFLHN